LMAQEIARGVVRVPLEAWPIRTSPRPVATSHVECCREVNNTKLSLLWDEKIKRFEEMEKR
jgi:hypothetical protein